MNRIFISYRSSDGKKDAARLAADLNERYGDALVFYDKQDLVGGQSWRDAINATLGTQPVVLVLVTPDVLGALHPEGGRRIDREDDPIRNELLTAHRGGAVILPLLVDGMAMPPGPQWPACLRFFSDAHALALRTDDWPNDLQRIENDLRAHGIAPQGRPPEPGPGPAGRRRGLWWTGLGTLLLGLALTGQWLSEESGAEAPTDTDTDRPVVEHAPPPLSAAAAPRSPPAPDRSAPAALALGGAWWAVTASGGRIRVQLEQQGERVRLTSDPVPVSADPAWAAWAQAMRAQGLHLNALRYSADGHWQAGQLQLPYAVHSVDGDGPLDTGQITLAPGPDGQSLHGNIWSNGDQAAEALRLER
jgi:hypothetical protein